MLKMWMSWLSLIGTVIRYSRIRVAQKSPEGKTLNKREERRWWFFVGPSPLELHLQNSRVILESKELRKWPTLRYVLLKTLLLQTTRKLDFSSGGDFFWFFGGWLINPSPVSTNLCVCLRDTWEATNAQPYDFWADNKV